MLLRYFRLLDDNVFFTHQYIISAILRKNNEGEWCRRWGRELDEFIDVRMRKTRITITYQQHRFSEVCCNSSGFDLSLTEFSLPLSLSHSSKARDSIPLWTISSPWRYPLLHTHRNWTNLPNSSYRVSWGPPTCDQGVNSNQTQRTTFAS